MMIDIVHRENFVFHENHLCMTLQYIYILIRVLSRRGFLKLSSGVALKVSIGQCYCEPLKQSLQKIFSSFIIELYLQTLLLRFLGITFLISNI